MRKEYSKAIRQLFARMMQAKLPEFREERIKSIYLGPGERAFGKSRGNLKLWVVLSPSPKGYDEFTVLIGWSAFGRYPQLSCIPSPVVPASDRAEFEEAEYLIRLPQLWTRADPWWVVRKLKAAPTVRELIASAAPVSARDAEELVAPHVEDAIGKLIEFAVPYLSSYARSRQADRD